MSDLPLTDPGVVDALAGDLAAAGYDTSGVIDALGDAAHRALSRGELWPALRATRDGGPLATLVRLFLLGATEPGPAVAAALPTVGVARAAGAGLLEQSGPGYRAALDVRPHGDDSGSGSGSGGEFLVVSDLDSDTRPGPVRPDHVLGIGAASMSLARAVIRRPAGVALDVGTGCGIQALHLNSHVQSIIATDTNPRALALAAATARLNGQRWDLRRGSLFEPVGGEQFDLVVSNPPFVVGAGDQRYEYRDSGFVGDGICERFIRQVPAFLKPGGTAQLLANWMIRTDSDWRDRIGSWLADSGCDAWVVQREIADPTEYVALWCKDAGESPADTAAVADAWLDWLDSEQVEGIGMGVVTLRSTDGRPEVTLDQITGAGEEVTGPEADAFLARRRWAAGVSDLALLATGLSLSNDVILEERALAGHQGWTTVLRMLRRPRGPGATVQLDEWGRALLAGCTGAVPLGVLVDLLAAANGLDEHALADAVLPSVRVAVTRGLLHPVDPGSGF